MIRGLWQLPQHLLALILIKVVGATKAKEWGGASVYITDRRLGISLGEYIIVWYGASDTTVRHEYGHTRQSRMLGPLYLVIVGIPSVTRNRVWNWFGFSYDSYYEGYPENWADSLGSVER